MMSDTPVAFSNAIILRPSFQIIFPLRSSLSSCTIVCVVSPVTSPAYCCIDFMSISRAISASRFLYSFFFFSISPTISFSYRSSVYCMRSSFAASAESPATCSSFLLISPCLDSRFESCSSTRDSFFRSSSLAPSSSSYFVSIFCSFSVSRLSCSRADCLRSRISLRASSISFRSSRATLSAREMISFPLFSASCMIRWLCCFCFCMKKK